MARRSSAAVAEFPSKAQARAYRARRNQDAPALEQQLDRLQEEASFGQHQHSLSQTLPQTSTPITDTVISRASFEANQDEDPRKDHFIVRNGARCAGAHLIADFHDTQRLDDLKLMEQAFLDAVKAAGATLLHIHMHHFTPNGGISGVAVLAESHISVHTWPERQFAAFDVFMCGNAKPELAIEVLRQAFNPGRVAVHEYLRGRVDE